jgi:hypothetical protein
MKENKGSSCGWSMGPEKKGATHQHHAQENKQVKHHASDKKGGQKKGL